MTRAYLGHQDVQRVESTADVAHYVAKLGAYVAKSAEMLTTDTFTSSHMATHAVMSLLREHSPGEAEMMQTLDFGGCVMYGCVTKRVNIGRPDELHQDSLFSAYCQRPTVEEALSFLEWLRLYDTKASPPRRYRRRSLHMTAAAMMTAS